MTTERSSITSLLPTHLRKTRRSWLFLLVVVAAVVAIVHGARTLARVRSLVAPGLYYNVRLQVIAPVPDAAAAAGVTVEDRITRVDGRAFASSRELTEHLGTVAPGTPVAVEIVRGDGPPRSVQLTAFRPSWATAWLRFLTGATFVLLGIVVFWFHPGRRESWAFLFASLALGVSLLMTFAMPRLTTELSSRVTLLALTTIGPLFVHLFAVFPRPLRVVVRHPRLLLALDLFAVAFGLAGAALQSTPYVTLVLRGSAIVNAAGVAVAIAISIYRLRRPASREDTSKLRALLIAVAIAFPLPASITALIAFRWWVPHTDAYLWALCVALLAFPVIVGHAIARRDLLDVDRAVARAAVTSALVGIIALALLAIALFVPRLVAPDAVVASPSAMAIVVLGGIAALWPVQRRAQAWLLARLASRSDELATVQDALTALADTPEPALFSRFERRLEDAFPVTRAALLLKQDGTWLRPATGEHVEPTAWPHAIELRRDGNVVGAIASTPPPPASQRALAALATEVGRALAASPKGERIGDYAIDRFIAAGGMGNVYLATKVGAAGFVKPVAIKQLLPEVAIDPAMVERFLREARLVAKLSHPGIVQTFELGKHGAGYYIVMEYVDGIDAATLLRKLKRRRERLPIAVACHIATSACLALEHAHRADLIHHDVSPHNLMIDGDGNVKLADFGVAHVRQEPARTDQLVGKIGYMAPEQLRHDPLDHRVDIFAAGIVLYELVTGQHPFAAGSDFLTLRAIENGRYLPAETIRDDCPPALALVIDRALASHPTGRYQSAAAFAEAIQRIVPLDSRHATELAALARAVRAGDDARAPIATVSLPR